MGKTRFWHLLVPLCLALPARGQDSVYVPVVRKRQSKMQNRWTVADALSREGRRPRDPWSPWRPLFEIVVDLHAGGPEWKRDGNDPRKERLRGAGGGMQVHYRGLGFGIGRDQLKFKEAGRYWNRDEGTLFLRVLGSSTQTTGVTLLTGLQKSDHDYFGDYDQSFYGVLGTLYLSRYLGTDIQLRQRGSARSQDWRVSGNDSHIGIFWEISILRLYLLYRHDEIRATDREDGTKTKESFMGTQIGARLYF